MKNIKLYEEFEVSDDDFKEMEKDLTKLGFSPIMEAIENGKAQFYFGFIVEEIHSGTWSQSGGEDKTHHRLVDRASFFVKEDKLSDLFSKIESELNGNVGGNEWYYDAPEFSIIPPADSKYTPKDFWEKFDNPLDKISKIYENLKYQLSNYKDVDDYGPEYEATNLDFPWEYAAYQVSSYSPLYIVMSDEFSETDLQDETKSINIGNGYLWR